MEQPREQRTVNAHLERARAGIRRALAEWNAADLARVEQSRELLTAAVGEMRIFEHAVQSGDVPPTAELYSTILAAKAEVVQATRVVDACVAFHRGLTALSGGAPPVYNAGGQIAGELPGLDAGLEPEVHA
jgi:hypothetical protein